jgi:tRNA-splicing ligase RtcB
MEYKIFGEHLIEPQAINQFHDAISNDWVVKAALMPDSHLGYSLPIGGVVAVDGYILPSWVGYDIGCGMSAIQTIYKLSDFTPHIKQYTHAMIHREIPVGLGRNHDSIQQCNLDPSKLSCIPKMFFETKGLKDIGTLGSGNHFIELGYDEQDNVWIVIHSGSRSFGYAVADYWMKSASLANDSKKTEGHFALKVNSNEGKMYINDMNFCLDYALENRKKMLFAIGKVLIREFERKQVDDGKEALILDSLINRNHNHAEFVDGLYIHRKGATHSNKDMYGVIPGSMGVGSFIVKGKGNIDSLCSSSHGAGRRFSRNEARRTLSMDQFQQQMTGIVADVNSKTLDESPMAYKDVFEVLDAQKDLIEIIHHIKPIINVKGVDKHCR